MAPIMTDRIEKNRTECSIPCNLCGSLSVETLSLTDRNGDYLRTVICKKCGLIWSDPRPSEKQIKEFYSKEYRKEYKGLTKPKKKHVYRDAKEAIKRYSFFKDILKRKVSFLDIGAGNGVFVYCLRKLGINAKGIEPDENHAQYAIEELNVPVSTGFAQDINNKESFNIVTLHHVLEHMADPLAELKNIHAILKENGYLVVEVPNAEDIKQDPKNRYHKAHIYTFNPETLIAMGNRAGFKVFRKKIAPLNGNISIIFQKTTEHQNNTLDLNENFLKVTTILNRHTNFRHFTTIVPYKKFLLNAFVAIKEQIEYRKYNNDKGIIDTIAADEIHHYMTMKPGMRLSMKPVWAYACATIFLCLGLWGGWQLLLPEICPVTELAEKHQDGNDRFYVLAHSAVNAVKPHANIGTIRHHREIEVEHEEETAKGVDAHFLISVAEIAGIEASMNRIGLRVIQKIKIGEHWFALLSSENYGQQSDAADGYRRS